MLVVEYCPSERSIMENQRGKVLADDERISGAASCGESRGKEGRRWRGERQEAEDFRCLLLQ